MQTSQGESQNTPGKSKKDYNYSRQQQSWNHQNWKAEIEKKTTHTVNRYEQSNFWHFNLVKKKLHKICIVHFPWKNR